MSLIVDNPIINSPFEEPSRYWDYKEGQPVLAEDRSLWHRMLRGGQA